MPVRHVLVVDDSKSARLMLRKMLQGLGLTVDTADSAEEALSYLHSQQPEPARRGPRRRAAYASVRGERSALPASRVWSIR